MQIRFNKDFAKKYDKVDQKIREAVNKRIDLFVINKFNHLLNNHILHGEFEGCRSINITGDYRAIFKEDAKEDVVLFIMLGRHTDLYE